MATDNKLMTAEELFLLPDDNCRRELLDGVPIEMSPPGVPHAFVMANVATAFVTHVKQQDLGRVLVGDPGIILRRNPDRVRAPDACFISYDRLLRGDLPKGYLEVLPEFVIEIVSPDESAREAPDKIHDWLNAGVLLAWAIYPNSRSISTFRVTGESRVYHEADEIDGGFVLPDFRASVASFFA